jgi:hypothetical protein
MQDWASLIFVRVYENPDKDHIPCGYIYIRKPSKYEERSRLYSLPSGHRDKKADGTPLDTAARELPGETGIHVRKDSFRQEGSGWLAANHHKFVFSVNIALREAAAVSDNFIGDDGERPKFFSIEKNYQLIRNQKFLPEHYKKLLELGLLFPPPPQ